MSLRVRWYNRLAAWLYEVVAYPLMDLAMPAWEAEAEADIEEQWKAEQEEAAAAMAEDYRDARNVDLDPGLPF